jgi:predicted transcriptional regulator YdeE
MQQTHIERPEIKLVGISMRTSYSQEVNKMTGCIFPCVQRYFHEKLYDKIPHRTNPGTTLCVYTDYESDYTGAYTYFIGEEVDRFSLPEGLHSLIIPSQPYVKYTTQPAPMPDVIINAWMHVWASDIERSGKRRYAADFEVYDERASDHQNIVLDIYVGLKKSFS